MNANSKAYPLHLSVLDSQNFSIYPVPLMQALRFTEPGYSPAMRTLETDIEIGADGSVKLLSPLPAWLKPGRAHVRMTVESLEEKPKRQKLTATPDFLARQQALFGSRVLPDSQSILEEMRADRF